ncbi:MAG: hypothetical protein QXI58_01880 [Candidatus Micrarchaeia archaeon]
MSTRGMIAYKRGNFFKGVYHSFDSMPTSLGRDLWNWVKENGVKKFRKLIDASPGGFNYFNDGEMDDIIIKIGDFENGFYTCLDDPLFLEWVYVIDGKNLAIYHHAVVGLRGKPKLRIEKKNNLFFYGHCVAKHFLVGKFSLRGKEPDWQKIEEIAKEKKRKEEQKLLEKLRKLRRNRKKVGR